MIADQTVLADIQADWRVVRSSQDRVARNLAAGMSGIGGIGQSHEFRNFAHALCLFFAFSVLEKVLLELRDQGKFGCQRSQLQELMRVSASVLPWHNYTLVDQGRISRNKIAHEQAVIERSEIWRFIDAIEMELKAWSIVS